MLCVHPAHHTFNTEVSRVRSPPAGLPAHRYVMISEPFNFLVNNDPSGNLTAAGTGWAVVPDQRPPQAPAGGPSIRWSNGWYYVITGGGARNAGTVQLARSRDLRTWTAAVTMVRPTRADNQVAPFAGFAKDAYRKGFDNMMKNWSAWDHYSNDGEHPFTPCSRLNSPPRKPPSRGTLKTSTASTSRRNVAETLLLIPLKIFYISLV